MRRENVVRILLIASHEDHLLLRRLTCGVEALSPRKIALQWAPDFEAGSACLVSRRTDVCFLAEIQGDASGRFALTKLREGLTPGSLCDLPPIVLLTNRGSATLDSATQELGIVDHLDLSRSDAMLLERVLRYVLPLQEKPKAHQTEDLYRQIVEKTNEGIWTCDAEGRTTFVNSRLGQILGYSPGEMRGTLGIELVHPEDVDAVRGYRNRRLNGLPDVYEARFRRKDGDYVWTQVASSPLLDAHGNLEGAVGIITDITERKVEQAVLQASEMRFRSTLESLIEGCQIIDRDWRYRYVNPIVAQHARRSQEEMVGRQMWEIFPGIDKTAMFARLRECLVTQQPRQMENEFVYPDGTSAWFQIVVQPVPEGLFILSLDVTERRNSDDHTRQANTLLEQRVLERTAALEAANKELEAFSYSVSHDLRAPLRAISGFSQIVAEDFGEYLPLEAREYLGDIRTGAKQMSALVDNLLAFSRLNRQPMTLQPVDMTDLVRGCVRELDRFREGRQVEIRVGDLPPCLADAALLKQVWRNLLSNALKYSAKRELAIIEVEGRAEAGRAIYTVRDNGVGFDMRYAHKLFGVFQRLHRSEEYEGTGVGLAVVQRIVCRHGGTVHAEAEPDKGAAFSFTLDRA